MEFRVCESACPRGHHHCLFAVFSLLLPWLFIVTTLSLSSSLSVGWMILSSPHPPSSKTSYFSSFRPFQIAFNTQCKLVLLVLFFCLLPLSISHPLTQFLLISPSCSLFVSFSQSLSPARVQRSFRMDNIHIHRHKTEL